MDLGSVNAMAAWGFLTNHGLVLTHLGRNPDSTGLAIAQTVGVTERAARKIVAELMEEGYIEKEKVGRRNRYRLNTALLFPHPGERAVTVGELLGFLWGDMKMMTVAHNNGNGDAVGSHHEDKSDGTIKSMEERQHQAARSDIP
jgi:hypothetical protein